MQGAPLLELRARLAGTVATYDDGSGADADAEDTHVMVQAGAGDAALDAFDGGLRCQVSIPKLPVCVHAHSALAVSLRRTRFGTVQALLGVTKAAGPPDAERSICMLLCTQLP